MQFVSPLCVSVDESPAAANALVLLYEWAALSALSIIKFWVAGNNECNSII